MISQIIKIVWKNKGQNAMLLLEIFLSFMILVGVLAFIISNVDKLRSPLGFETENRLVVLFVGYYEEFDRDEYKIIIDNLKETLGNTPEIKAHCFGNSVYPFSWNNWSSVTEVDNVRLQYNLASFEEVYEEVMGLNVIRGRMFNRPLDDQAVQEVIVSQLFAKQFGDRDILDTVINLNGDKKIVGIVDHYKYNGEFTEEDPMLLSYQSPYDREYAESLYIALHEGTPTIFEERLSRIIQEITGRDFIIRNLDEVRHQRSKPTWLFIIIICSLAIFLVVNVAVGLFGVLWYSINKRRYEISIRKAMGASEANIMGQFVMELMGLAILALAIGVLVVWQMIHFELVSFYDRALFYQGMRYALIFILLLVLGCAIYPSWKAATLSPSEGLKEE